MVLIIVVSNISVEAQGIIPTPTTTTPKDPPKTPPSPPPPPPPPPSPPPPPPPKSPILPPPKSPILPPPPKSTDTTPTTPSTVITVTTPQLPPPTPSTPKVPPPSQPEPPPPSFTAPASPSPQIPITQLCTTSNECDTTKFCNQGTCQPRGSLGNKCINRDGCLSQFICNKGVCQYRDDRPKRNHGYDVKKAAITGGIIVGVFAVSGFIFVIYRSFKKRKERKGRELTSSIYSTDGTAEFDPIYPFSERSNSFSNSKPTPPSHVPTTNRYEPTGNAGFVGGPGPRKGYYNYYNNDYNGGGYMRQNENERTINLLQQTRGNVMIAPHAPHAPHASSHIPHVQHPQHAQHLQPHLQQNYNWNYGVPGVQTSLPAQQLMMDQGGLFPVPSVKRQYGGPIPNNMNNDIKNNPIINKKKSNNSFNSSNSSNSYEDDKLRRTRSPNVKDVNSSDKQKKTQNLRDLLNSNSSESIPSNISESCNVESIYDIYTRESIFKPKTLEVKLSQVTNDDDSTIDQNISEDSKSMIGRTRSRTFGHTDSPKVKSSTVEEQKSELNGINENDEI